MDPEAFHRLTGPTEWAPAPSRWSFSTLERVQACPLQWQLLHSHYGDHARFPVLLNGKAVSGSIVHAMLEKLLKGMAQAGYPQTGTPAFADTLSQIQLMASTHAAIEDHHAKRSQHPRVGTPLVLTARDIFNEVCQLFREYYHPHESADAIDEVGVAEPPSEAVRPGIPTVSWQSRLQKTGLLTEVRLHHPTLPLLGVIDLVKASPAGTVLVDFKTGAESEQHQRQLMFYALLWWRVVGEVPAHLEARYRGRVHPFFVLPETLEELEHTLAAHVVELSHDLTLTPARAVVGPYCGHSEPRAFCRPYWETLKDAGFREGQEWADVELDVVSPPLPSGFRARTLTGSPVDVVITPHGDNHVMDLSPGERIRVLNARVIDPATLSFHSNTEIYVTTGAPV